VFIFNNKKERKDGRMKKKKLCPQLFFNNMSLLLCLFWISVVCPLSFVLHLIL